MTNLDPNGHSGKFDDSNSPDNSLKSRTDYPRRAPEEHNEEYAAEFAPTRAAFTESERQDISSDNGIKRREAGKTVGYIGVGLGIASLFMWSIILGPIAAVLGFYAYSQGRKASGAWAAGLGIVATLSYFVLIPFTR
ncbi:DUF5353 domain-containing protein [Paenibacillus brevis]|uniref:DUF5353 domain-containing protein n=1 Tax=Paenibacillus brevis TaxID=2841508 RepID=A0ABS6FXF5_9BACL|nr:DUF5353 domain-containing protein [Paenibacillus brevis]MBU5674591.1 DUF5353 domain-containing protein [Paenibacillus brevis]